MENDFYVAIEPDRYYCAVEAARATGLPVDGTSIDGKTALKLFSLGATATVWLPRRAGRGKPSTARIGLVQGARSETALRAGSPLTYPVVQSLVTRFPSVRFGPPLPEGSGVNADEGTGGGGAPEGKDGSGGDPTELGGGEGQLGGEGTGDDADSEAVTADAVNPRRDDQRGSGRMKLSTIWPSPKQSDVAEARRIAEMLYEAACDDAGRETNPHRWDYARLAVGSRTMQLDRARTWERQAMPRLMLAVDTSASCSSQVDLLLRCASALAEALPWLVVIAAPNGVIDHFDWTDKGERLSAMKDGQNWNAVQAAADLVGGPAEFWEYDGNGWKGGLRCRRTEEAWTALVAAEDVAGIVYLGDYETEFMRDAHANGVRCAAISNYCCSVLDPVLSRTWRPNDQWPVVIGNDGSMRDLVAAFELIAAEWRSG